MSSVRGMDAGLGKVLSSLSFDSFGRTIALVRNGVGVELDEDFVSDFERTSVPRCNMF